MKPAFFHVGKERIFPKLIYNLAYGRNMSLAWILGIDQNIIQIHDNKNFQLFSQNLLDVSLKVGQSVKKTKKHDLIFEMTISSSERRLPFVAFTNPHPIIVICQILYNKFLSLAKSIR